MSLRGTNASTALSAGSASDEAISHAARRLLRREERLASGVLRDPRNDKEVFDVAIIGAGAVGSAIAREISQYDLKVVLLESNSDVGMGTSKASTAIWHTGYDATPGSLESKLLKRSYPLMEKFMKEVGSPFELVGGLLIAWNEEQYHTLPKLLEKAIQNGDTDCYLIEKEEVYKREPHLGEGALGGMVVPREGILCTFTIPLACATQAVVNGVTLKLNFCVNSIHKADDFYLVSNGSEEEVHARWVINAAGLYSDEINQLFGHEDFKVTPRRGELIVYDKLSRRLINHVLLPVPTATTKGVLVSPTIYGNVLLGPTAEDLPDKTATNTSSNGLQSLLDKGKKILPDLLEEEITATYAGLRAATEHSDYQIALHVDQHYICVGGIRSTGISGCLGIAEYVADLLKESGVELKRKPEFKTIKMPNIGEAFIRPYQSAEFIAENSDYGNIVCHCERVSLGELNDAMVSPIPATSLDALRRRTRAMQGRCQGFNCQASLIMSLRGATATKQTPVGSGIASLGLDTSENNTRSTRPALALTVDTLIVGAGPAGLSAALELKRLGVKDVVVAERESEAGGIPRLCGHTGFGLKDFHRVMTGPSYARRYRELAKEAQLDLRVGIYANHLETQDSKQQEIEISYTSPSGIGAIEAKSVLLATGVRERPRSARLIPGHRPQGVFTTGSLQRFVYEHNLPVGRRAVIVGAEIVSLSVVTTLLHAGVKVLNMVTELPGHQLYLPIFLPAKIFYADILARAPILTNKRVTNILGRHHVEGIETTDLNSGKAEIIECDAVVFTGDWIPENELARRGEVETFKPSFGPQVDAAFRTSRVGVFAAGNLLRGVETADWAALEGRRAARSVARWLENAQWSVSRLQVQCEAPIGWICPNVLSPDVSVNGFRFWSKEFRKNATLQLKQAGRVLYEKKIRWLKANIALSLSSDWVEKVDYAYADEPVKLVIQS
jgi:glycerol-3-phosphate dehydrogenase